MKNQKGFSLIELLIVVVIIGIIAAIAIPNLLAARRSANEGSAISACRTIHGAQMTYAATYGAGKYAGTVGANNASPLTQLSGTGVNLVDSTLGGGFKSGYAFVGGKTDPTNAVPATFWVSANPQTPTGVTATGTRRFGIATEGVIIYDSTVSTLTTPYDSTMTPGTALGN